MYIYTVMLYKITYIYILYIYSDMSPKIIMFQLSFGLKMSQLTRNCCISSSLRRSCSISWLLPSLLSPSLWPSAAHAELPSRNPTEALVAS